MRIRPLLPNQRNEGKSIEVELIQKISQGTLVLGRILIKENIQNPKDIQNLDPQADLIATKDIIKSALTIDLLQITEKTTRKGMKNQTKLKEMQKMGNMKQKKRIITKSIKKMKKIQKIQKIKKRLSKKSP